MDQRQNHPRQHLRKRRHILRLPSRVAIVQKLRRPRPNLATPCRLQRSIRSRIPVQIVPIRIHNPNRILRILVIPADVPKQSLQIRRTRIPVLRMASMVRMRHRPAINNPRRRRPFHLIIQRPVVARYSLLILAIKRLRLGLHLRLHKLQLRSTHQHSRMLHRRNRLRPTNPSPNRHPQYHQPKPLPQNHKPPLSLMHETSVCLQASKV